MQEEVLFSPEYAVVRLKLSPGESVLAEPGAMISMTPNIEVKSEFARGGFLQSLGRAFLGGESFFTTTFTAQGEGELVLGRGQPGDVAVITLNNETVYVQSGGFIACTPGVNINTRWGGFRSFFGIHGLFLLEVSGTGKLIIGSFGSLHMIELGMGQDYIIDTGHVAAFHGSTMYTVTSAGGFKNFLFSGEGLVCQFRGPGKIWMQTRNPGPYVAWVDRFRPVQRSSNDD